MNIAKVSLKELLANSKTKSQLTKLLGEAVLDEFQGSKQDVVVSYCNKIKSNRDDLLPEDMVSHAHEEADTMIPLHVLDIVRASSLRAIDVWSPDTDVLILLIDLAANGHLGVHTKLRFLTGKGTKYRSIDIRERVSAIGLEKSKGLIGLHHFTGADWGRKYVGVSKKSWISAYLQLAQDNETVVAFQQLGSDRDLADTMIGHVENYSVLPEKYTPLEGFVCSVYSDSSRQTTLPLLRWELFRQKKILRAKSFRRHEVL